MPKSIYCLFIYCLFFSGVSVAQGDLNTHELFNETSLLKHIQALSSDAFEGRRTNTEGAIKAKKYIINQFNALHVLPLVKDYNQNFTFINKRNYYKATNVLGIIKGSESSNKYIVLSAHYDHEGVQHDTIYNGADDNASGISALFSFAEYFIKNPPKHSVILAAFDAEELGLQGSKYFVNNPIVSKKDIILNINMDMISRSEKDELFVVGTAKNKQLKYIVSNIEESKKIKLLTGHEGYDGLENWTYASDHANFYKKDIPFLYFGVEDHKDYHEPTDDYENIKPEFYINAVKTIISVFEKIDNSKF
ncbi:Peptidase family M28 [Flaviramulus basaltis]|uniref:Peptidase family M28 n=1 Tax=Flaviramulus basaltis TaxID=369401 RepID=A0A1K2IBB7_9FLAO|nr:M28 family peptidase [Flaviramulus basaltis]SFZ89701.1 Peptidase family M28 [Flaviramulus basaltis]